MDLPLELKVSMGDTFSVFRNNLYPDHTKEIGSKGNHVAAGIQSFSVGMSIDDGFVDGSECCHKCMFETGLMEHLQFQSWFEILDGCLVDTWRASSRTKVQRPSPSLSCQSHDERLSTNSNHAVVLLCYQTLGSII